VEIDTAHLSRSRADSREDGRFLYTLPSWWTTWDFAISHIMRGEESRHQHRRREIEIFEALGAAVPTIRPSSAA